MAQTAVQTVNGFKTTSVVSTVISSNKHTSVRNKIGQHKTLTTVGVPVAQCLTDEPVPRRRMAPVARRPYRRRARYPCRLT